MRTALEAVAIVCILTNTGLFGWWCWRLYRAERRHLDAEAEFVARLNAEQARFQVNLAEQARRRGEGAKA